MKNIYLVGYMGSGKSTAGRAIARELNLQWIDLDEHLESKSGNTIAEIFNQQGEAVFRTMESDTLKELARTNNTVVSSGGGTPVNADNMQLMKATGLVIFLDVPASELARRIWPEREKRPLVKDLSKGELESFIARHLAERLPFYSAAHIRFSGDLNMPDEMQRLLKAIRNYSK